MMNELFDPATIENHRQQAHESLSLSREYLSAGKLHRASETGWDAAVCMVKAVATAQGWEYRLHDQFGVVMNNARMALDDDRLRPLSAIASDLRGNYYKRKFLLDAETIGLDLDSVAELLEILEPLAHTGEPV